MKTIIHFSLLVVFVVAGYVGPVFAQEVSIPDPGLNAVVRATLQKPNGPLTEQDLLTLTNLSAITRNIQSIIGLESAQNLGATRQLRRPWLRQPGHVERVGRNDQHTRQRGLHRRGGQPLSAEVLSYALHELLIGRVRNATKEQT